MSGIEWDVTMDAETRAEFEGADDEQVAHRAIDADAGLIARSRATFELTRRALSNHILLGQALDAINLDHVWIQKQPPPLGWLGAVRILGSADTVAIAALLQFVSKWELSDQQGLFQWCLPRGKRKDAS